MPTTNQNTRAMDAINKAQVLVSQVVEEHGTNASYLKLVGLLDEASRWNDASLVAACADGADMSYVQPRKEYVSNVIQTIRKALGNGAHLGKDGLYGIMNALRLKSPDYLDAVWGSR